MLKAKSFLGVDFGAGCLKVAEFAATPQNGLRLLRFAVKPLGLAGSQEAARDAAVKKAVGEVLTEGGFLGRQCNLTAPGFQVFSKFVKLPPVDTSKVTQIIQYEAQQNVPFPLAETSWDYQILGSAPGGELEVLLVAVKTDIVEKLFAAGEAAGLKMSVVDASSGALANAFRYNYADQTGVSLLIDIGAKTSNVLVFEGAKYYFRGINLGANAITQEFAAETKLRFDDAEKFKIGSGFVSLGGAYEEPDDPRQAAVSKVARNVLTRLHLQVNQTIQFYRTQQGGGAPTKVFLAGGGAAMGYAAEFFQEKLNLPVEFFNPFRNLEIDPTVDVAELEKVAQSFGEVVGAGLRNVARCPVEFNLMPKAAIARQQFNAKKPFLIGAAYAAAAGAFAAGLLFDKIGEVYQEATAKITAQSAPVESNKTQLNGEIDKLKKSVEEAKKLGDWLEDRTYWANVFVEIRRALMQSEESMRQRTGSPAGVWVETLLSTEPTALPVYQSSSNPEPDDGNAPVRRIDPLLMKRYGLDEFGRRIRRPGTDIPLSDAPAPDSTSAAPPAIAAGSPRRPASTNEIATIKVTFRAVNLKAQANSQLAFEVEKALKASPAFDAKETKLIGQLETVDDSTPSFTFPLSLVLKRPIKL